MESVEIIAASLAAAKALAAEKLGVSADQLEVAVLEESKGLFGKGSVKIRAVAMAMAAAEPSVSHEPAPKPKRSLRKPLEPPAEAVVEAPPARPARRVSKKAEEPKADEPVADVVAGEADAEAVLGLLRGIVDAGQLDVKVSSAGTNGRYVNLVIDGKDVGHLVGKQGEVLNALQYLLNIIINQQLGTGVRATLDGNDYRQRREAALTKLANAIADQVVQRSEEAVLDALPAFERRIVHKALSENPKVTTYSEGEEPNRRVVIAPAE